ncbi:hypothetical protein PISMIDRAFT_118598 [Pisolithus microcarpus 441]|uniref:Uncharacterized protein n=1 Tax=Pisolithus microcarpus 441 TaxID=765257 RepID=A0A0C9XML0_9AGAM|nr:hypothetical protein PISMIDRAFT_118598 [Pisolithus microcarpus 441]
MSSPSPTCHSGELEKQYAFMVTLMVYSSLKSKMKGKTSVLKEVKSIKTKELSFPPKADNYLDFLQGILDKHGQDHYKISEKKQYSFKYIPPKTKGQCVGDVMDVDNEANYQEMVAMNPVPCSPLVPSPTQLLHFLCYAEVNLGICNAIRYEKSLEVQGIGPDILANVNDKILTKAGLSVGNIIHLKRGCTVWQNSLDVKCKHSNTETLVQDGASSHSPHKRVAYERWYFDGGASWFASYAMTPNGNNFLQV